MASKSTTLSDKFIKKHFDIDAPCRKRGGDNRNPSSITHYAVIDAVTGEVINEDCKSLSAVCESLGFRGNSNISTIRKYVNKGAFTVTPRGKDPVSVRVVSL